MFKILKIQLSKFMDPSDDFSEQQLTRILFTSKQCSCNLMIICVGENWEPNIFPKTHESTEKIFNFKTLW